MWLKQQHDPNLAPLNNVRPLFSVNWYIFLIHSNDSGSSHCNNAILVIQSLLWWTTQHHCMATSVLSWSQAIAYQRLSGEDIGGIDMTAVWEGMALQQGHKSRSWQSHCQHSSTSADKGLCSPPNTHRFWWVAKRVQSQSAALCTQSSGATPWNVRGKRLRLFT